MVVFWRRKVRESRERGTRIATETAVKTRVFNDRISRVNRATNRAERAASALIASHDALLKAAASARR